MSDPTPAENARFVDIGGGTIAEMMSNQVQFFYDPTTGEARAHFNGRSYLPVGSKYIEIGSNTDLLQIQFNDPTLCYGADDPTLADPVTGADLSKISVAGVMVLIKKAYDKEYNARASAIAAALAAAEQLATVMAAFNVAVASPAPDGTTADFTAGASNLRVVAFTDTSTTVQPNTITAWAWHFGDGGATSIEQNPVYTFSAPGEYTVQLAVTDSTGVVVRTSVIVQVT